MQQKIVLIGGPGTGKSSVLKEFIKRGYHCMPEISREVILQAREEGIEQLFLENPILFSQKLLAGREKQYLIASESNDSLIFFDRGIPDIHAYMNFLGTTYTDEFVAKSNLYLYDQVFMLAPWKEIYASDNERYETFEQAVQIDKYLRSAYQEIGYKIIDVPFGSIEERCNFIVESLKNNGIQ